MSPDVINALPVIITAVAGLVTAISGLIVAVRNHNKINNEIAPQVDKLVNGEDTRK